MPAWPIGQQNVIKNTGHHSKLRKFHKKGGLRNFYQHRFINNIPVQRAGHAKSPYIIYFQFYICIKSTAN
jgi:hypothetical protein